MLSLRVVRFGAALAEDIDRLWEFLDNGQDVNDPCLKHSGFAREQGQGFQTRQEGSRCFNLGLHSFCCSLISPRCMRGLRNGVAISTRVPLKRPQTTEATGQPSSSWPDAQKLLRA